MKQIKISRKWLVVPAAVLLGLSLHFYVVHRIAMAGKGADSLGINTHLPQASIHGQDLLNKKLQYEQAERDSMRKAQFERLDPYRRDSGTISRPPVTYPGRPAEPVIPALKPAVAADPRAEQVLQELKQLQQIIRAPRPQASLQLPQPPQVPQPTQLPQPTKAVVHPGFIAPRFRMDEPADTAGDARVGRLNALLDKVIRVQHPEEERARVVPARVMDEVGPADSGANTIPAVVADDQTLTNGTTIALRVMDSIRVNGRVWPAGQLVYGTVSINDDRMLVHVGSLREDRSLFVTDLQVYDLDGIAGIHIPGMLGRDVAKQSADQGVNSVNVFSADPTLGAQAANAGIQTVKSFVGRKVKQVRVSVRAGYQVLLRAAQPKAVVARPAAVAPAPEIIADTPDFVPEGRVIAHCRVEGMRLRLRGIWLLDGRLWFGLEWENRSVIAFSPAYTRWFIRDRRQVRRTAMQEVALEPLGGHTPAAVGGDSTVRGWVGFRPFALAADKELVLEVGEKGGARELELVIKHQQLLNAKAYVGEKRENTATPDLGAL